MFILFSVLCTDDESQNGSETSEVFKGLVKSNMGSRRHWLVYLRSNSAYGSDIPKLKPILPIKSHIDFIFQGHNKAIMALAVTADGQSIYSASYDGLICILHLNDLGIFAAFTSHYAITT